MRIIEIAPLQNGAHNNQQSNAIVTPHDDWAIIPDDMPIPDSFPFVNITVDGNVVTSMTAAPVPPQPEPKPAPPSPLEQLRADVDFIALMQGVTL